MISRAKRAPPNAAVRRPVLVIRATHGSDVASNYETVAPAIADGAMLALI